MRTRKWLRIGAIVLFAGATAGLVWKFQQSLTAAAQEAEARTARAASIEPGSPVLSSREQTIRLSPEAIEGLCLRVRQVEPSSAKQELTFTGSVTLDPNRVARIHARFPGEVVDLGTTPDTGDLATSSGQPTIRRLRFGDHVKKGQLLAVVWSKEIGDVKSDLVDAVSRSRLDQATLKSLLSLDNVVAARSIREAKRASEADIIAIKRAVRTLRSWRLSDAEIEAIMREGEHVSEERIDRDPDGEESRWAQVQLRAPFDGVILEQNAAVGDVVDTSAELFKIADLSRVGVLANVYEEDLDRLLAIPPADRYWTIRVTSSPSIAPIRGKIDRIGNLLDPGQHTVAAMGWIDNPDERLRIGQFITATVVLPHSSEEVLLPTTALIDEGRVSTVFVTEGPRGQEFTRRRVAVTRHASNGIFVRLVPTPTEAKAGAQPLKVGEWVVTQGVLQLANTLDELQSMRVGMAR